MGFLDKIKGAVKAVTGGAAKVTLEYDPQTVAAGSGIKVKVSALSTGAEVKSKGLYIDLRGVEDVRLKRGAVTGVDQSVHVSETTFEQAFQIAPEFVIAANETKLFEGVVEVPTDVSPTFNGKLATYKWEIQARVDAFGNDPDSGFLPLTVTGKV